MPHTQDDNTHTVILASKRAIYDFRAFPGATVEVNGTSELAAHILNELAEAAAKRLKGTLVRTWHDHDAGGAFAEIQVTR